MTQSLWNFLKISSIHFCSAHVTFLRSGTLYIHPWLQGTHDFQWQLHWMYVTGTQSHSKPFLGCLPVPTLKSWQQHFPEFLAVRTPHVMRVSPPDTSAQNLKAKAMGRLCISISYIWSDKRLQSWEFNLTHIYLFNLRASEVRSIRWVVLG